MFRTYLDDLAALVSFGLFIAVAGLWAGLLSGL